METNSSALEINWKETAFFLKELIKTTDDVPEWIRIKARTLFNNYPANQYTPEFIFSKAVIYFKIENPEKFFKRDRHRKIMDYKHIIRYVMYVSGIHLGEIADFFKMHRTTTYNAIETVRNLSAVDIDFNKKVSDFLLFCEL